MQNFSSLALKLREKFEVTDRWMTFFPAAPLYGLGCTQSTTVKFLNFSTMLGLWRDNRSFMGASKSLNF